MPQPHGRVSKRQQQSFDFFQSPFRVLPCESRKFAAKHNEIIVSREHQLVVLRFEYQPSVKKDFAVELAQSRAREKTYRSTLIGPHRDELLLALNDRSAAQFGSEGQKRTLAIALKIAQAEFLTAAHGAPPVLLIDDIMGELDLKRRSAFVPLLEKSHETSGQVFMTATEENWPRELGRDLQRWHVENGMLKK